MRYMFEAEENRVLLAIAEHREKQQEIFISHDDAWKQCFDGLS
ncbi:MAG: hypothetical protein WC477_06535 [Patescibacteria group bacterium]